MEYKTISVSIIIQTHHKLLKELQFTLKWIHPYLFLEIYFPLHKTNSKHHFTHQLFDFTITSTLDILELTMTFMNNYRK